MKVSVVFASALGLAFMESGFALDVEEERQNRARFAYHDSPYQVSEPIMRVHRPNKSRVSYTKRSHDKTVSVSYKRNTHSGIKFHGLKRAFPSRISPPGVRLFIFSPRKNAWAAYMPDGRLVGYGRASGGAGWCSDIKRSCRTPRGTFTVHSLGSAGCKSTRYPLGKGGAPMPYCMFFSKYYAVHGSPHVPNYNASHGCVRVKPVAAKWLRYNFMTIGTRVVVTSY